MREKNHGLIIMRGVLGFFLVTTACVIAGYGILSLFDLSGIWQTLLSLWVGSLIFAIIAVIAHFLGKGAHEKYDRQQHGELLDAMAKIASGNFSVFVQGDNSVHAELAEAINTMAKNLGNLETMRQDFISNVSHEIQSPLTSIRGFAALLKKDELSDNERRRYIDIIEAESKRLSSLSDNLLKLSALDNKPMAKIEYRLDRQLSEIILMLEPQWSPKNLIIEADLQKTIAYGDEDLLSQVWVNLLHNAIKFTPENGCVTVSLYTSENNAVCRIFDTGVGISPEDKMHIFERFYKADKARDRSLGGSGLGLSLVKKIIDIHDGTIIVASEIGKGSTFTVTLTAKA